MRAQRSTQRAVVALVWGYGFPRGRELATEGVPGSDQDRLNEGLQVCAGQPGPSTLVANRSRVLAVPRHLGLRHEISEQDEGMIKMTTTNPHEGGHVGAQIIGVRVVAGTPDLGEELSPQAA